MLSLLPGGCGRSRARQILGMNRRERELVATFNPLRDCALADDKILTKTLLAAHGLPIPATYAVIEEMRDVARFKHVVGGLEHFVIKPACGKAGAGIVVLGPKAGNGWYGPAGTVWDDSGIRQVLGNILLGEYASRTSDRALIEERLFAGPVLGDMPTIGLPDIRVITLQGTPVMSMVRLPTRRSAGKANLHLGAVGVGVDLQTGRTIGGTWRGRAVTHHPETNRFLAGIRVTAWDRVMEIVHDAARVFPLGYLGFDISITREGRPVILEVNARPGLEIQNANSRGLRPEIARVLGRAGSRRPERPSRTGAGPGAC